MSRAANSCLRSSAGWCTFIRLKENRKMSGRSKVKRTTIWIDWLQGRPASPPDKVGANRTGETPGPLPRATPKSGSGLLDRVPQLFDRPIDLRGGDHRR